MHGEGKYVWPSEPPEAEEPQRYVYLGEWENGKRKGNGVMEYGDLAKYVGQWVNDKMEGNGKMYWY